MQRWQLSVQQELPGRVLLDVGYVGHRATKLEINRDIDALPNQWLSQSPIRDPDRIDFLTTRIARAATSFSGRFTGPRLAGETEAG